MKLLQECFSQVSMREEFGSCRYLASTLSGLGITAQTLRNHLHHINQKLRTHNRLEAVMNAIQRKLI